ncbi:MAG TPA: hypothetical protein DCZ76_09160 [Treponema sp.]|nr:hypothetical protein [Treponema sp.]
MKQLIIKKTTFFSAVLALALSGALFTACQTSNPEVPANLTAREIIQKAQNAYNAGREKQALYYYDTLIARYGMNTVTYIEGKYEIAHIYVKAKKWDKAIPVLKEIKNLYASSLPGSYPGEYLKMVENDLAKVPEKYLKQE